jgi:RNA polymerase sigma factor (sigma-70 family)
MDFADFYRTTSPRTLRYAYGLTGDLPLAQDVTQEAYARAWQRWRTVSEHHDVEAWLRVVITRLVFDWWRRLGVRRSRMERPATVPPPSEETVLLSAALQQLPRSQARALALHYLLDLPIAQIAAQTGVAEGTVKSWLSRGRAGLAEMLRDEVEAAKLAPAQDVQERGTRRRRTQMIVAGIAVLAVLAGLGFWRARGEAPPPAGPSPLPSASPVAAFGTLTRTRLVPDRIPDGYLASVAIAGDRGYVAWSPPGGPGTTVTAIDLTSGTKLWSADGIPTSAGLFYANPDGVLLQGFSRVDGRTHVVALGVDGKVRWTHDLDREVTLLPYRDMLVQAAGATVMGLDWRTGEPRWEQSDVNAVFGMHRARDAATEATRLVPTETGKLMVVTGDGKVHEIDPVTGEAAQQWDVPVGPHASYYGFDGKVYAAVDNRLTTVDPRGSGPSYQAPQGHQLTMPVPCFTDAVCVVDRAADAAFLVIRGNEAVLRRDGDRLMAPSAAANAVLLEMPTGRSGEPQLIWTDTAHRWHTAEQDGNVLWIDSVNVLAINGTAVSRFDPAADKSHPLGTLPAPARAAATDGVSLIAVMDQGIGVYHLTQ